MSGVRIAVAPELEGPIMARVEFEMALEVSEDGAERPWTERVRRAAETAGGDLICVLPIPGAESSPREHALVRLPHGGEHRLVAVRETPAGLAVRDEDDIDGQILDFARASVEVLELLRADTGFRALAS